MVDWQITAKTIYCEMVDDEVTLMVYKDGAARCSAAIKFDKQGKKALDKVKCDSATCRVLSEYKDKLFIEEAGKNA